MKNRIWIFFGLITLILLLPKENHVWAQTKTTNTEINNNNEKVKARNKIILEVNKNIKDIDNKYKFIVKEFKRLEQDIQKKKNNKIVDQQRGVFLQNDLKKIFQNETKFYQSLILELKNIDSEDELKSFLNSKKQKRLMSYQRVFDKISKNLNSEEKMHSKMALITLISYIIIIIFISLVSFILSLVFIYKRLKKWIYKKYIKGLVWNEIISVDKLKYVNDQIFINELNIWIEYQLKLHFNEVLNNNQFVKNKLIIDSLWNRGLVSKKVKSLYDEYVLSFLSYQIILYDKDFEKNIKNLIANHNIELSTSQLQVISEKEHLLEQNLQNNVLNYQGVTWAAKNIKTGQMTVNPESMFIFKPEYIIITNNSLEIEINYEKLYLNSSQKVAFKDLNYEYYFNFNDDNKLEIQNYVYRKTNIILWTGVNYANI